FVSVSTRLPPTPTLVPYTTLFRSLEDDVVVAGERSDIDGLVAIPIGRAAHVIADAGCVSQILQDIGRRIRRDVVVAVDRRVPDLDRKSTRLNSSHVSISYAVFCLK